MIIIRFILFMFLLLLVIGIVVAALFAIGIRKTLKNLRGDKGGGSHSSTHTWSYDSTRNGRQQSQNRQTNADNETIIDQRSPEEANRKIISDSEGEYIDFTEE